MHQMPIEFTYVRGIWELYEQPLNRKHKKIPCRRILLCKWIKIICKTSIKKVLPKTFYKGEKSVWLHNYYFFMIRISQVHFVKFSISISSLRWILNYLFNYRIKIFTSFAIFNVLTRTHVWLWHKYSKRYEA